MAAKKPAKKEGFSLTGFLQNPRKSFYGDKSGELEYKGGHLKSHVDPDGSSHAPRLSFA